MGVAAAAAAVAQASVRGPRASRWARSGFAPPAGGARLARGAGEEPTPHVRKGAKIFAVSIAANAPLWAGEAEIVRTYWTSPVRTRETDKLWLRRQCWKEYCGLADSEGATPAMVSDLIVQLQRQVPQLDITVDRHDLRGLMEKVYVEYTHYCLFSDVHDTLLDPGEPKLNANKLTDWPEENARSPRAAAPQGQSAGKLGRRATDFTEGGYCTMYSEGAKLKGRPGLDGAIGRACQKVFDDELGHMMAGVVGVDDEHLSDAQWAELTDLTNEQLRLRLYMRNAQFSHPLTDARIAEILAGRIEPIAFDFAKAETFLEAHKAAARIETPLEIIPSPREAGRGGPGASARGRVRCASASGTALSAGTHFSPLGCARTLSPREAQGGEC